ncbi:MAG: hypothetical protein AAB403_22745 [Planctomycetota bacterium]
MASHIDGSGTMKGAPGLKPEHLPVFDCSLRPANGTRFIHHVGHVRMMAAVQPFLSGASSKTINMPEESTVDDIMNAPAAAGPARDPCEAIVRRAAGRGGGMARASG